MSGRNPILGALAGALLASAPALLAQWPTSGSFMVHPSSRHDEIGVQVGVDAQGRFWEVEMEWIQVGENLFNSQIVARRFDDAGALELGPVVLNGPQRYCCPTGPGVAVARRGNALLAWSAPDEEGLPSGGPYARAVSAAGEVGPKLYLPAGTDPAEPLPGTNDRLAARADGSYAATWRALRGTPYPSFQIAAASFASDGTPFAPAFMVDGEAVSSYFTLDPSMDVAPLPGERLFVVWSDLGADGDADGILGRIFEADGTPVTGEIQVNTFTESVQFYPKIAADRQGRSIVVWDSAGQDGYGEGIYGQRFDAAGAKIGPEFRISSDAPSAQLTADVAMDEAGDFVVVWSSYTEFLPELAEYYHVFGRAYRADATPVGPQFWISEDRTFAQENDFAEVALSDAGTVVVGYHSEWNDPTHGHASWDVFARTYALPCREDERTLCLGGGRFLVRAFYDSAIGLEGPAHALPLTTDSGGFWFFGPDNFELLVKVLDGCGVNGSYWIYAAGLTDVEVDLVVTDTWTGRVRTYSNPLGTPYAPVQRVSDLATCGAPAPPGFGASAPAAPPAVAGRSVPTEPAGAGGCQDSESALCLTGERFRVTVAWQDFFGGSGSGHAVPFGTDSGLFWFFGPENLELAIKVLDGCFVNDRFWVYAAGLTNVAVRILVEDTATGARWSYDNPLGQELPPVLDSSALDVCGGG